jgi:quinohemoprotein ethanol dehydrogenase
MSDSILARAAALCVAVWLVVAGGAQAGPRDPARDFSAANMIAPPTKAWLTNGGNVFNQRYSPLAAINRANVAGLKGVWRTRLRGSGAGAQYSGEAQPIAERAAA